MSTPTTITTSVHLYPGTPRERVVKLRALVSLSHGRYRIDRLEVLEAGHLAPAELEAAYDKVVDTARAYAEVPETERRS